MSAHIVWALLLCGVAAGLDRHVAAAEEVQPHRRAVSSKPTPADPQESLRQAARELLGDALESEDSYTRWFALRASQSLADPSLAEHARKSLALGDRYDHSLALEILARVDPAGSREDLLTALDSPHRSIRLRALTGLATLKDPGLASRFTEVLAKDDDPDLRAVAVRALAETGSPQTAADLYRALEDPNASVQEEAVRALVSIGSPGLSGVLRRRLAEGPPDQRVAAIRLASFSSSSDLLPDLAPFLTDGDPEVRAYAASAILSISEPAARP